jgi:hypothetical protein
MNNLRNLLLGTALAAVAWPALAHGDEDHSEPNPVVAAVPMAAQGPRAEAQTDAFELVASLEQDRLVLHIDRFDTNEPVEGAQVEVDTGTMQAKATQSSPGVYWVAQGTLGQPGKHPLTSTIETEDTADLLTATLEVPAAPAPTTAAATSLISEPWMAWGLGGTLLLSGAGLAGPAPSPPCQSPQDRTV